MRTKNTLYNIITNFIILSIKTILMFVVRKVFIDSLGLTYLGVDGLLTNILSMLAVAELGIGTVISYSLYDPLSKNDIDKVSSIMTFYKKLYRIIGIFVLIIGIILYFFLGYFNLSDIDNLPIIYFLYLLNTVCLYFISYKETLIIADQKKYKLAVFETSFLLILNIMQIIVLIMTKNYIAFLIIMFLTNLVQRVLINRFITKEYPNINFREKRKLNTHDLTLIKRNTKGMIFHKIGDYCINCSDNIIISTYSIQQVGIYSNYLMLIVGIQGFLMVLFNGIVASMGNLIAIENRKKQEKFYNIMNFIGLISFGFFSIAFFLLANSFIEIAFGKEFLLPQLTVLIIAINIYLSGLRIVNSTMVNASGLNYYNRHDPLFQAIINIVISVILVRNMGVLGVVIGTMVSGIAVPSWHTPYIIAKRLFHHGIGPYVKIVTKNTILGVVVALICYMIFNDLPVSVFTFLLEGLTIGIILFVFIIACYRKDKSYLYCCYLIKKALNKKRK